MYTERKQIFMKNLKSVVKTFLFSVLLVIVILTTDNTVLPNENMSESSVSTCCEEYPDLPYYDSGH